MYAVIMAGGGGTRLHPLSRPERPKPFLPLIGDRTLLQQTVDALVEHELLPARVDMSKHVDASYLPFSCSR